MFAPTRAICVKEPQPGPWQRSILKPVSLLELSVHLKLMQLHDATVAVSMVGAAGTDGGDDAIAENRYAITTDRRRTATSLRVFSNLGVMIRSPLGYCFFLQGEG